MRRADAVATFNERGRLHTHHSEAAAAADPPPVQRGGWNAFERDAQAAYTMRHLLHERQRKQQALQAAADHDDHRDNLHAELEDTRRALAEERSLSLLETTIEDDIFAHEEDEAPPPMVDWSSEDDEAAGPAEGGAAPRPPRQSLLSVRDRPHWDIRFQPVELKKVRGRDADAYARAFVVLPSVFHARSGILVPHNKRNNGKQRNI